MSVWMLISAFIAVVIINMTGRSNAQPGPLVAAGAAHGVLLEYWTNLVGVTVKDLLASTNYPLNPSGVENPADFEGPTDRGDLYGERYRAWLVAPVTGDYTFWIASDDDGELWLSSDDDPAHKQRIANAPYWTGYREWTKFPEQHSAPVRLEAGRRYYLEALHYQHWGAGSLSVGWQRPGTKSPEVISGAYLAPYNLGRTGEGLALEIWTNAPGATVSELTNSPVFRQPAALGEQALDFAAMPHGAGHLGVRLRGYVHAPVSGAYTFWIAGGKGAQLWLGRDDNPASRQLAAVVPAATSVGQWNKHPEQRSAAFDLEGGKVYYVEALAAGTGDAAGLAVAWQLPDGTFEGPVPASRLTPYDSDYDGMPDWYERQKGLNPYDPDDAGKDADFDGLSNLAEYRRGSDPKRFDVDIVALGGLSATGSTRGLLWECWTNLYWGTIPALTGITNYPLNADQRDLRFKFESPGGMGTSYGERMRGWLLPVLTGDYSFWIAADDEGELWLSTDANPAHKKRIASTPHWTGYREWNKYLEQYSGPIHLEAGKAYYIEGLHYQGQYLDHFSVAWQPPGAAQPEVITMPYLAPYNYGRLGEGITREVWSNVVGVAVADLTNSAAFRQPAGLTEEVIDLEAPVQQGKNYGQRLRGYLHPPAGGAYRFWIAASDTAQLWLGTDDTPTHRQLIAEVTEPTGVRQWNQYPGQRSGWVNLEGGKPYYIEVLHQAGGGTNHVSVAWQMPDGTFEGPIPGTRLTPYDADYDGMPDWYEKRHGFDPYNPDDANQDADFDGLSNLQEFLAGTDPNNWDTYGIGVPDGVAVLLTQTNLNGGVAVTTEAAGVDGAQGRAIWGRWQVDGTDIYALDRRGTVEFTVSITNGDKYLLELKGAQNQAGSLVTTFDVDLSVDGEDLGHHLLLAPYGSTNGVTPYVTPFLLAGQHTVRVFWDGAANLSSLRIRRVSLVSIADADSNHNGIKDWVEHLLNAESGLDTNTPTSSYVSPVCLEGRDPYLSMMAVKVASGTNLAGVPVSRNAGRRWYANTPLSTGSNVSVSMSYQNGVILEQRQIQWLPINVLDATNVILRPGDSLLLGAGSGSPAKLQLAVFRGGRNLTNISTTGWSPAPYRFVEAGTYTIAGSYGPQNGASVQTGTLTVKVIDYTFPYSPECMVNRIRNWDLTNVPPEVVVEADPRLNMAEVVSLPNQGRRMLLSLQQSQTDAIVSRLGNQGSILGSVPAVGFHLFATPDTYNTVITQYPDGSRLVETMEVLSPVLPDLSLQLKIIVGGVTFDDGTLIHEITAADFDSLGECKVRFIMPSWVQTANCHVVQVFQGSLPVGTY